MNSQLTNISLILNTAALAVFENIFALSVAISYKNNKSPFFDLQLVTINPSELLCNVFSKTKLKVNELRNLNCNCRDLVQQSHGSLISFIVCLC